MLENRFCRTPAGEICLKPPPADRKNDNVRIGQIKTAPFFPACVPTYTRTQSMWKIDHPCFLKRIDFFYDGGGFQINSGRACLWRSGGSVVGLGDDFPAGQLGGTYRSNTPARASSAGKHKRFSCKNDMSLRSAAKIRPCKKPKAAIWSRWLLVGFRSLTKVHP